MRAVRFHLEISGQNLNQGKAVPRSQSKDSLVNMSTRHNNESHYENHQRAVELHDGAAHAHRVAEEQGKQDHLTGHEHSQQPLEHSQSADKQTQDVTNGHGVSAFGHDDIAPVAYALWQARGCPHGSSQEDWFHATEELRSRVLSRDPVQETRKEAPVTRDA